MEDKMQRELKSLKQFYTESYFNILNDIYVKYPNYQNEQYFISYMNIIKRYAELCTKLKIENNLAAISILYEYLLWGGYFSKDHKYVYNQNDRKNNFFV